MGLPLSSSRPSFAAEMWHNFKDTYCIQAKVRTLTCLCRNYVCETTPTGHVGSKVIVATYGHPGIKVQWLDHVCVALVCGS